MISLPNVTLICIDCVEVERAVKAIEKCKAHFKFEEVKLLTSLDTDYEHAVKIPSINSIQEYSKFMIKDLHQWVDTEFAMTIQWDAYILNPEAWTDDFLKYDYIGAPWWFPEKNVGNGAFSIRSKKLLEVLRDSPIRNFHPEDVVIGRLFNKYLQKQGIVYAPEELAHKFSFEGNQKYGHEWDRQLGFHDFEMTKLTKYEEMNKKEPELHCIYRYHDGAETRMEGVSKIYCANNFRKEFKGKLTLINDNCKSPWIWSDSHSTNLGNAGSFIYQLNLVKDLPDDDYVYFVEDDYLHWKSAEKVLLEGLKKFPDDAVTLYDHPDKYQFKGVNPEITVWDGEKTVLSKTDSCHWKMTNSTTMTFAAKVSTIKMNIEIMEQFCDKEQPRDYEMWKALAGRGVKVWCSVPGYSTHCHEPWISPLRDWTKDDATILG